MHQRPGLNTVPGLFSLYNKQTETDLVLALNSTAYHFIFFVFYVCNFVNGDFLWEHFRSNLFMASVFKGRKSAGTSSRENWLLSNTVIFFICVTFM